MLLDFFMPALCAGCGQTGGVLCGRCTVSIATCEALVVGSRGGIPPTLALGPYEGPLRAAILALKFRGARGVGALLGKWIAQRIFWPFELVIPVPLHAERLRERGYNQAALIARSVAASARVRCIEDSIARRRSTVPQSTLGLEERRKNVEGAFGASDRIGVVSARRVLVVDDVVTTGATVAACASFLRAAGARCVYVACAAIRL
ncbi:MAG TPA: phosphoribosyltransferase family protein [Candidatus Eremiobacteraceae bacterium]|nr:phosphoribosyltransferase family protein [Candidatus Eremiobacteraceae bacterium]